MVQLEISDALAYDTAVAKKARNGQASIIGRIPKSLEVFAWNLNSTQLGEFGKRQLALNVIERGRAWHWRQIPKGWFDLEFCLRHGQKRKREALRALFSSGR